MVSMLRNQNIYEPVDEELASYAVVGSHPSLDSGVLYWMKTRHQAEHNANAVRMTGGSADVKTKAEADKL